MMKAYPKYKDSGIEWIGNIPAHWDVIRLKYCTDCFDGKRIPVEASKRIDGPYPYWGGGGIQSYVNDYLFDEELVLLGEDGAPFFDKQRPVAHYVTNKVWVNNHIHVLKARNNIEARFLTYALNSVDYSKYIEGSILSKLTQSDMNKIQIPLPPISEQQTVVGYLDDKSSKLDECVRLLELQKADLTDYRKALISDTVTRGLNPNAKLKDSGIQWLGQIPETWKINRIKHFSKIQTGNTPSTAERRYFDGNVNWFTPGDFKGTFVIDNSARKLSQDAVNNNACRIFPANSIYLIGIGGTLGKIAFSEKEASANQQIIVISPNETIISKYIAYFLSTKRNIFELMANAATLPILSNGSVANMNVPIPPLSEQQEIVEYLDTKTAKIDETIRRIDEQIADLRAYRTALISDVVTGKIDVRI